VTPRYTMLSMAGKKEAGPFRAAHAGTLAGTAASAMMDVYWWAMQGVPGARPEQQPRPGDHTISREPATQNMADAIWRAVTGSEVPRNKKAVAGVAMHYAFGAACGALWGLYSSLRRRSALPEGVLFGVAIWLLGDEMAFRVSRMSPEADKVPLSEHAQALGAHLVYGAGTAAITERLAGG
jgi:uncharacterized membrane protein YagU involved in acid resistance